MGDKNDVVETAVTNAIAGELAGSVPEVGTKEKPKDEKLDAQAELFVRKITDALTRNIAELLKPSNPSDTEEEDVDEDEDSPVRRKRKSKPAQTPKKSSFLTFLG